MNFRSLYIAIGILLASSLVQTTSAQQTGLFEDMVTFTGVSGWPIWFYVPPNYNPAHRYKLVVGLQDNGDNPHDYLKYYMMPLDTTPGINGLNAIFVAPAPRCASCDFFNDTNIITVALQLAMSKYSIDSTHIYMNGFSQGGRAALRYGLINYWRFRGIEVRTPALHGILEAEDKLRAYFFPYGNGRYIPVSISLGTDDTLATGFDSFHSPFRTIVTKTYQNLCDSSALAKLTTVYGMGHNSPHLPILFAEYSHIDSIASSYASNDAGINSISAPAEQCLASYAPVIAFQNKGINNLDSVHVSYQMDGGTIQTQTWTGNLKRLGSAIGWDFIPDINTTKLFGAYLKSASSIYFDNLCADNTGKTYSIRTPQYDFSVSSTPSMTFDYAYAPQAGSTGAGQDTLAVTYSVDCGSTWKLLYKQGGINLSTSGGDLSSAFYPNKTAAPGHDYWKTATLPLTNLAGQNTVMFSFDDLSEWGNILYLDNITIHPFTGIANEKSNAGSLEVYPNPNNGQFTISFSTPNQGNYNLKVENILGQALYLKSLSEFSGTYTTQMNRTTLSKGLYFVRLESPGAETVKKIIVN